MLNNLACHGSEACECLVQHQVLQKVLPILKSHDVELLDLCLGFIEMMLRQTEMVILDKFDDTFL